MSRYDREREWGTPSPTACRFPSLQGLYADPQRRASGEVDFGVQWLASARLSGATWRLSWIRDTGELYVTPSAEERPVYLLGVSGTREETEALLSGWADACGPGGLAWLAERTHGLPQRPSPAREFDDIDAMLYGDQCGRATAVR